MIDEYELENGYGNMLRITKMYLLRMIFYVALNVIQ